MTTALAVNYTVAIRDAICRAWPKRHRAKRVAQETGASPRTIEDWTSGRRAPNADQLVALMAASPDVEVAILELVAVKRRQKERDDKFEFADAAALQRRDAMVGTSTGDDRRCVQSARGLVVDPVLSVSRRVTEQ